MPTLVSLIKNVFPPEFAPERIVQGDQYDIKIYNIMKGLLLLAGTLDEGVGTPSSPIGTAGGDLRSTYPNPIVKGIQTTVVDTVLPTDGQLLRYDASDMKAKWTSPETFASNAGTIQDIPVSPDNPGEFDTLMYNGSEYVPTSYPLPSESILPKPVSTVDYITGKDGAASFATKGNSASLGVTVSSTPISRGINWSSAGTVRMDSTRRPGWVLLQPSEDDGSVAQCWSYLLTGGVPTSAAIWLVNSFDDSSIKTGAANLILFFSQSSTGSFDPDNYIFINIGSTTTANQWTINTRKRVAGVSTDLDGETVTSPNYPYPLICIEKSTNTFRIWVGPDKNSLKLVTTTTAAINPDRISLSIYSKGRPNTVFGINQILKTTTPLL